MAYLLDTNVISEFARSKPDRRVIRFLEQTPVKQQFIADIVLAEISFGISLIADTVRCAYFTNVVEAHIRPIFDGRILSADETTWLVWKRLERDGRKRG